MLRTIDIIGQYNEEAYFNILKHNEVFFNQKHKKLCQLGNQYIECSCEECRK